MSLSVNPQPPVTTPITAAAPTEAKPVEGSKPLFKGTETAPVTTPAAPVTAEAPVATPAAPAEAGKKLNIVA